MLTSPKRNTGSESEKRVGITLEFVTTNAFRSEEQIYDYFVKERISRLK